MTQNIGIYKWTNKINGKIYIGQSVDLNFRKNRFNDFSYKKYGGDLINRARQKYNSKDYWSYEVLEYCKPDELNEKEIYYIDLYNSMDNNIGYNLTEGGGGRLGYEMSEETKKKIGDAQKGKKNHRFGYHLTDEEKKNLSKKNKGKNNAMYGKTHTEETKELISNKVSKPIYQIDKDTNEIIREWKSAKEAGATLGMNNSNISACCKGKYNSIGGFKWCFKDKPEMAVFTPQQKTNGKKTIYQIDLITSEIIKRFDSIKEAADTLNICAASISSCCRGVTNKAGGYVFKYCAE